MWARVAFFAFLCPIFALAGEDDWNNLGRLSTGDRIQLVQSNRQSFSGKYLRNSPSDLTMSVEGVDVTVARDKVVRVSRSSSGRRVRNAALFGLLGGLVGAAAMRFGAGCNEVIAGCAATAAVSMGGMAVGAGVGAFLPAHSVVYRVRQLPSPKPAQP